MKTLVFLTLALLTGAHAAPVGRITTLSGKTFSKCNISRVQPDGVTFTHANGAAKILFTDLSDDWRGKLGYSPRKAAAYKQDLAEKRAAEAAARRKREAELGRALAEAEQRARIRQLGLQAQAQAVMQEIAANSAFYQQTSSAYFPVLPALGLVHGGSPAYRRGYNSGPRLFGAAGYYYPGATYFTGYPTYPGYYTGYTSYPGSGVCAPRGGSGGFSHGHGHSGAGHSHSSATFTTR